MSNQAKRMIPVHETKSKCSDVTDVKNFGVLSKKNLRTIRKQQEKSGLLDDPVTFPIHGRHYPLPIGSTIIVYEFPFEFIYGCDKTVSAIHMKWLHESKSYNCQDGICLISIKSDFSGMNDANLMDFIITGNTQDGYQFSTYGTFLFIPG